MARQVSPEMKTIVLVNGPFDGLTFEAPLAPKAMTFDLRQHLARYELLCQYGEHYYQFRPEPEEVDISGFSKRDYEIMQQEDEFGAAEA